MALRAPRGVPKPRIPLAYEVVPDSSGRCDGPGSASPHPHPNASQDMPNTAAAKHAPMDRTQLEAIERLLLREREKTLRSLGRFQEQAMLTRDSADTDLSSYSFHMADQ